MKKKATADMAINKLGKWNYQYTGEDLSTIKFFNGDGHTEIAKPSDFPTDAQIAAALIEVQTMLDNKPNVAKSGNDKLLALGLSQDEVTAMTGYRVPRQ